MVAAFVSMADAADLQQTRTFTRRRGDYRWRPVRVFVSSRITYVIVRRK